jgi:outer membrane receptor protein involved in Fe transport
VRYGHDLAGGRMQHDALVSHVAERDLVAFPGAEPFAGAGGYDPDNFGAIPEWKGNYRAAWKGRHLELGYSLDWIDAIAESGGEVFPGTVRRASSVVYHDLHAGWRFGESLRLRSGVDNLTDVQPPFLANGPVANTDVGTYRLLGRTYWLRLDFSVD